MRPSRRRWAVAGLCWLLVLAVWLVQPAAPPVEPPVRLPANLASCSPVAPLVSPNGPARGRGRFGGRHLTSNHKSGTGLNECLRRVLRPVGLQINGQGWPGWRRDRMPRPYIGCRPAIHASGGFSSAAWQVNMVRDPLRLVESGWRYHRGRRVGRVEGWVTQSFGMMIDRPQFSRARCHTVGQQVRFRQCEGSAGEAHGALAAFNSWPSCAGRLHRNETYASAISRLPLAEGLLLEALRALYRDIPNMLAAARDCRLVGAGEQGSCQSVDLDSLMGDYRAGFARWLAPGLRIATHPKIEQISRQFEHKCRPANRKLRGLTHRLRILRQLDRRVLNGSLQLAQRQLSQLI